MEKRNLDDLKRDDIAVYNFRGYTVIRFWKQDTNDGLKHALEFANSHHCQFIPEDFRLMSEFLKKCYEFSKGNITEINHVKV